MTSKHSEKQTQSQKYANDKQYYRDRIDRGQNLPTEISTNSFTTFGDAGSGQEYRDMKIWYDLYNNIIHQEHFQQYCTENKLKAYANISEAMINRDICSSRIDTILGVESSRPFKYQAVAVNPEATTLREEEESNRLKKFLLDSVNGAEIPQEQLPPRIRKYMQREFQVPQEVMANQVLNIGYKRQRLNSKFQEGLKHMALSTRQIYHVVAENGEPTVKVVNPLNFQVDMGENNSYIHLGNEATAVYQMHPAEVCHRWKDELTNQDIEDIWEASRNSAGTTGGVFNSNEQNYSGAVRVIHRVWRGMRKVGFLEYIDEEGRQQSTMVSENYKLNRDQGDIKISWKWLEEIHEGYKLGENKYVSCGPVKYQHVISGDLQRPWLPYVGGIYDSMNSTPVSKMGRMLSYQYFYNIVFGTIDRLISNDRGKKIGLDMSSVPRSLGIGLKELISHMEEDDLIPLNSNEDGKRGDRRSGGIASLLSAIDLSPTAQLQMYEQLGEMAYVRAGQVIGITPQMEGAVKEREAAANVQNSINLSSSKLSPFYEFHDQIKADVLMSYLKLAQLMYYENPPNYLSYSADDMSISLLQLDPEQFLAANYSIYINDSSKTHDAHQTIDRYLQAALQNQTIDPAAALAAMRQDSFHEAEEILAVSAEEARASAKAQQDEERKARMAELEFQAQEKQKDRNHDKEMVTLKAAEDRITKVATQIILAQGFNEDKDMDKDGKADTEEFGKKVIEEARKIAEDAKAEAQTEQVSQ